MLSLVSGEGADACVPARRLKEIAIFAMENHSPPALKTRSENIPANQYLRNSHKPDFFFSWCTQKIPIWWIEDSIAGSYRDDDELEEL